PNAESPQSGQADLEHEVRRTDMKRLFIAAITTMLFGCGPAFAQIGTGAPGQSPVGITSPLGIGPGLALPPARVPLGASGLATPGVSPTTFGTSPTTCAGIGGSSPQASFGLGAS